MGIKHQIQRVGAQKSTAARKDVSLTVDQTRGMDGSTGLPATPIRPGAPAGTQALPVESEGLASPALMPGSSRPANTKDAIAIPKHKGGRPSTGFDKKAYMSAFMRDKRKADKLGLKVSEYRKLKGEDK